MFKENQIAVLCLFLLFFPLTCTFMEMLLAWSEYESNFYCPCPPASPPHPKPLPCEASFRMQLSHNRLLCFFLKKYFFTALCELLLKYENIIKVHYSTPRFWNFISFLGKKKRRSRKRKTPCALSVASA